MKQNQLAWLPATLLFLATPQALAADYPSRPIRILASDAGGGNDFAARIIANELSERLPVRVIVENRGGILGSERAAKAVPDGYTLLLQGSVLWLLPFMRDNVPWDPLRDFEPITVAISAPNVIVAHPSVPAKSARELIDLAKRNPGTLNYAIGGLGSAPHLSAELFKAMAAIDMVRVNYKGGGPAFTDLIAGQVQLMFPSVGAAAGHIKAGRLRPLGVTSIQASPLLPGVPPVAAALPGYEVVSPFGVFAPAKTPAAVVRLLNKEIVAALNSPSVKERFFASGVETVGSSPQALNETMRSDMKRLGKVIKDAGIRAD